MPSGVFILNFEQISHIFLVFLLRTLNMQIPAGELIAESIISKLLNGKIAKAYKDACPGFNKARLTAHLWVPSCKYLWSQKFSI